MCDMTHSYLRHDTFICATWRIHMCDMTHSYLRHDTFICATWRIHMCDMTHSYLRHDAFICATWHVHMCDMTHSYVRHDAFICATWRIHMCDMTHSYVTWRIHTGATLLTRSGILPKKINPKKIQQYLWREFVFFFNCGIREQSYHTCKNSKRVASHIWMRRVTRMNASSHEHKWVMSHIQHTPRDQHQISKARAAHYLVSHVTHMNESCHTYECVVSHV